jgi:hypothetical protein
MKKLAVLFLLFAGSVATADTLRMQGISVDGDGVRPTRGMTQARVEQRYGAPNAKRAAVGDPPISRWEYDDFIVYFEYDKVIHAVIKR